VRRHSPRDSRHTLRWRIRGRSADHYDVSVQCATGRGKKRRPSRLMDVLSSMHCSCFNFYDQPYGMTCKHLNACLESVLADRVPRNTSDSGSASDSSSSSSSGATWFSDDPYEDTGKTCSDCGSSFVPADDWDHTCRRCSDPEQAEQQAVGDQQEFAELAQRITDSLDRQDPRAIVAVMRRRLTKCRSLSGLRSLARFVPSLPHDVVDLTGPAPAPLEGEPTTSSSATSSAARRIAPTQVEGQVGDAADQSQQSSAPESASATGTKRDQAQDQPKKVESKRNQKTATSAPASRYQLRSRSKPSEN
jgi:hypothetical protein